MLSDARSRQRLTVVAALLLGMVLGAAALRLSGVGDPGDDAAQLTEGEVTGPTQFTISSLNVLGADHTAPGGNRPGWASGEQRMKWLTQVMDQQSVEVIGLQEFQYPQYKVFEAEIGATWDTYPALEWGKKGMRNSVALRSDQWELVSGSWEIPYFNGTILRMPVVRLRNLATGQEIFVGSFHNPADVRGPAAKWRKQATEVEIAMVNRLRLETGLPVFVTGDMNERDIYFCRMTAATDMVAANGGFNNGTGGLGGCGPTRPTYIDWDLRLRGDHVHRVRGESGSAGPQVDRPPDDDRRGRAAADSPRRTARRRRPRRRRPRRCRRHQPDTPSPNVPGSS